MSKYVQLLRRLEADTSSSGTTGHEGSADPSPRLEAPAEPAPIVRAVPLIAARSERHAPVLEESPPPASPGLDTLLDRLRVLESTRATRRVVFAAAAPGESVRVLVESLATRAAARDMKVVLLTLKQASGQTVLTTSTALESLPIDMSADATPKIDVWLEGIAPDASLALIEAPALGTSGDAGLLARTGDGLVIVAHVGRTERTVLRAAAERARATGCRTLGIVAHDSLDRLPAWVGRLVST